MPHAPHLQSSLHQLLSQQPTATLAVQPLADFNGAYLPAPLVSLTPWAWDAGFGCIVLMVSDLASHTQAMKKHAAVSLLISAQAAAGQGVHGIERVSLSGVASIPPTASALAQSACRSYLARFPEAQSISLMPDFHFVCVTLTGARHVAGFGSVRDLDSQTVVDAMNLQDSTASSADSA